MNTMRIAVDARTVALSPYAGIANYVRQFLRTAPSFPGVELIALSGLTFDAPAGVRLVVRPSRSAFYWDQAILPRLLNECSADVFLNPLIKAPLRLPCPMAWIINDCNHLAPLPELSGSSSLMRRLYFGSLARLALRHAPAVGAISEYTARQFSEVFGYPREQIDIIPLAASPEEKGISVNIDEKYGFPRRFILYLGNFSRHKNIETLLRAYALLPAELRNDVSLVLAGEKTFEYETLRRRADELGIARNVRFTGPVPEGEKGLLFRRSDVFVLPSVSEGFGLPLLEAMSRGTPVLAADAGALPEVAGDPEFLFPARNPAALKEKLEALLGTLSLRERMRQKAQERSRAFSPELMTNRILSLCRKARELRS